MPIGNPRLARLAGCESIQLPPAPGDPVAAAARLLAQSGLAVNAPAERYLALRDNVAVGALHLRDDAFTVPLELLSFVEGATALRVPATQDDRTRRRATIIAAAMGIDEVRAEGDAWALLAEGTVCATIREEPRALAQAGSKPAALWWLEAQWPAATATAESNPPHAFVAYFDSGVAAESLALAIRLRRAGIATAYLHGAKNLNRQTKEAFRLGVSWLVLLGGREWERGAVALRNFATREEREVPPQALPELLRAR